MRLGRIPIGVVVVVAAALAAPAAASAARYVDDSGDDATGGTPNDCTAQAQPCRTIQHALDQAAGGEKVNVSAGVYPEAVSVSGGKALRHTGPGAAIIHGGLAPALQVPGGAATVMGFTLRSTGITAKLQGPTTLSGNRFDTPVTTGPYVQMLRGAGGSTVEGNRFADPDATDYQVGLQVSGVGAHATIAGNSFSGLGDAILVQASRPLVSGNTITGSHALGSFPGIGILAVNDAVPDLFSNVIRDPGAGQAIGIWVSEDLATVQDTGADIEGARIIGHDPGILVDDATGGVYLFSDLIARSPHAGLVLRDNPPTATGEGDVRARNVTLWGGAADPDVSVQEADLQLDSSIVGAGGIERTTTGGHCEIAYSRGPVGGQGECNTFDTVANPDFAGPAANDFHLAAGSAMVDAGNPTSPAVGAEDFDGDPRALDGDRDCEVRRDIGADELQPPLAGCLPPYQTRALRTDGRDFALRVFGPRGGDYTLCVRGPRRIERRLVLCHGFRLHRVRPDLFESMVQWGRSFRFMGSGTYTASWYQPGTTKLIGPRKTFTTGACPPQPQLMDGVWKPRPRLRVIFPCYTVTGSVTSRHGPSSRDGDYLVGFNTSRGRGFSHFELVPRDRGHLRPARRRGRQAPNTGERLRVTGVYVCDGFHGPVGHFEIHPVFRITYLSRRRSPTADSGPQFGGTPSVHRAFPGWHPCP